MAQGSILAGGAPTQAEGLVSADQKTILGSGTKADPLRAGAGSFAGCNVTNTAGAITVNASEGVASVTRISTGVVVIVLKNPPTNPLRMAPVGSPGNQEEALSFPALLMRVDTAADGSIAVRTYDANGTIADHSFTLTVSLLSAP